MWISWIQLLLFFRFSEKIRRDAPSVATAGGSTLIAFGPPLVPPGVKRFDRLSSVFLSGKDKKGRESICRGSLRKICGYQLSKA
jgi:hypothetical protein